MKSLEEIQEITNLKMIAFTPDDGFAAYWTDPLTQKVYSIIMSWGGGWEHLSVNPVKNDKTPSWDFMCKMKEMFFKDDEVCVQYHPMKKDYVNNMPHCLHIWRPTCAKLPIPPSIFVGVKEWGSLR